MATPSTMTSSPSSVAVALAFFLLLVAYRKMKTSIRLRPPPGPKPLPLLGNLLDMPTSRPWVIYDRWFKEFDSDIIHVNLGGKPMILLGSYQAAVDLLEKRSALYSSRMGMPMASTLMGWEFGITFKPYGPEWRRHRRLVGPAMNQKASNSDLFQFHIANSAIDLILRLMEEPDPFDVVERVRLMAGSLIMSLTYGITTLRQNDPYVDLAEKALSYLGIALQPGAFWVDVVPWLQYVPSWLPGAGFKRKAKKWREMTQRMRTQPYNAAKQRIDSGDFTPSFVSTQLEKLSNGDEFLNEDLIRDVAGIMYAGGIDTMTSTLGNLLAALALYPDVQAKAQAEIDTVCGKGRLPALEQERELPYLTAVVFEAFRWHPIIPFGFPHELTTEDVYKGYYLPKGSLVIANVWSTLYDPSIYGPSPEKFNPERFLTPDGKLNHAVLDPRNLVFGFGRRICPGRYFAFNAIWTTAAFAIATLHITPEQEEEPEYEQTSVNFLRAFKCGIRQRMDVEERVAELRRRRRHSDK